MLQPSETVEKNHALPKISQAKESVQSTYHVSAKLFSHPPAASISEASLGPAKFGAILVLFHHLLEPCITGDVHNQSLGWTVTRTMIQFGYKREIDSIDSSGREYYPNCRVPPFSIFLFLKPMKESINFLPSTVRLTESCAIARFLGHQPTNPRSSHPMFRTYPSA